MYCAICGKHRKFEKTKMSYLLEKTLVLSVIFHKCKNEEEKSVEILKIVGLIENIWLIQKYGWKKHKSKI